MSGDAKPRIAERAARELHPGEVVNLGIGIPNLIPGFLGADTQVVLHTENGLLGVGPRPGEDELDPDLIDAAKQPITALPGAAYFDSASSFAMIRGGHVDVAVLGALEVSARGDIANWAVPGKDVLGVGGAMDLVVGARRVIVTMTATSSRGEPKVVAECTYPLTAAGAADVIITELSVFRLLDGQLHLTELLDGVTLDDVAAVTTAPYVISLEESHAR
jgi:3-oxoacid CoA-transferase B subunit